MSILLETYKSKYNFWDARSPMIYHCLSIIIFGISLLILNVTEGTMTPFFKTLAIISCLVLIITHALLYVSYENLKKTKTGIIRINQDHFLIDEKEKVEFDQVKNMELNIFDYKGRSKYLRVGFEPNRSLGIGNSIKITWGNTIFESNFELLEEREIRLINNFLAAQIFKDQFRQIHPRKLVKFIPPDLRKSEESRNYIAKKIKTNQLNSTEGLLMMNYNSDREARELKEKYLN